MKLENRILRQVSIFLISNIKTSLNSFDFTNVQVNKKVCINKNLWAVLSFLYL